jgi:hypothetical protein
VIGTYRSFQDILNFLSFSHKFEAKGYPYPFTQDPNNVIFSWGQILIPKFGIREMVQNKISDIKSAPISEITMLYQIPFVVIDKKEKRTFDKYKSGVVNQNISLTFRYDKTYKYGDINKSIYEVCYYITEHAVETNDFFILTFHNINDFFSYYIIPNQWGLGATVCNAGCQERYYGEKQNASEKFPKLHKCPSCEFEVDLIDGNKCPECGYEIETGTDEQCDLKDSKHDLVEVVRCGECAHMQTNGVCNEFADDCIRPSVSDFCSYGVRKENC